MTLNVTWVECGTLGTDACAYRTVAEQLPGVAALVFDPGLRFELVTGGPVVDTGWRPRRSSTAPPATPPRSKSRCSPATRASG
ncbi:MAG TPA: hypothetical protein VF880_20585 [Actinomycetes bacterium]|jgi:hypothetical protein